MIINLPDEDALTETALRLYFDAWDRLRSILADWDSRIPDAPLAKPIPDLWRRRRVISMTARLICKGSLRSSSNPTSSR